MAIPYYSVRLGTFKKCNKCESLKPIDEYSKDSSKFDGFSIYCRSCIKRKNKVTRQKRSEKIKSYKKEYRKKSSDKIRDYSLKRRYGITLDRFYEMFEAQDYRCKICNGEESDQVNFTVDHCHKTGTIRGILCARCNRGLGMFYDDIEIFKKAMLYLKGELK